MMNSKKHIKILFISCFMGGVIACNTSSVSDTQNLIRLQQQSNNQLEAGSAKTIDNNESKDIIEAVNNFWKSSIEKGKSGAINYLKRTPETFWENYNNKNDRGKIDPNLDGDFPKGEGADLSLEISKGEYNLIKFFSDEIHRARPDLLKIEVLRSTKNEAVVKFNWRPFDKKGGWISQLMLLDKESDKWKIFMITDSATLSKLNPHFGFEDE